ncbi:MAG: hypothetical protein ACD_59C00053G0009 [uncultured bacterium]|nr:MAG: hypothetical protein ACD_59C00053G0009 [uncultured bacterium]
MSTAPKVKIEDRVLVISIAGKPLLKEAIEKACNEHNAKTLQPLTPTEFCAYLIEKALMEK